MKFAVSILVLALFSAATSKFIELTPSQYENNQTILECLNFGTSHIMKEAVYNGTLPDGQYEITQVNKVEQKTLENGVDYRFDFEIAGPQGTDVTGHVTVNYEWATEDMNVVSYKYHFNFNLGEESGENYEGNYESEGYEGFENWEGSEEAEFSWENYEFGNEEGLVVNEEWNLGDDFITFN